MNDREQIEALQSMNKALSKNCAILRVENKKLKEAFVQATVVLEDIADRLDMIKSVTGVEWIPELQQDIQHVLDLEEHLQVNTGYI